jgi:DNA-binding IclR family transcriptional regulator
MRILECFDADHPHLTATRISGATGLSSSTTHRLTTEMVSVGMLQRLPDGALTIGTRSWETSVRSNPLEHLRAIARPVMEDLHARFGHHLSLAVPDFDTFNVLYVERYDADYPIRILSRHASRLPVYANSSGLTMLAFADDATVTQALNRIPGDDATGREEDLVRMRADIAETRLRGYTHIVGGLVTENTAFAAPSFGPDGGVRCALSIVARTDRCDHDAVLDAVVSASRTLSDGLAADVNPPAPPA